MKKLLLLLLLVQSHALALQEDCLVKTVYAEARGEGITGMLLVANVIENRSKQSGDSICKTVSKPKQFAGWHLVRNKKIPLEFYIEFERWRQFQELVPPKLRKATHFHSVKDKPKWAYKLTKLGVWKNHVFYS